MFLGVSTGKSHLFFRVLAGLVVNVFFMLASFDSNTGCFSKNLGSTWEDLGKAMEGEDEIEVGQVDCSTSKPVCAEVDIHSYPTFKLFYNGEEVAKYQGKFLGSSA